MSSSANKMSKNGELDAVGRGEGVWESIKNPSGYDVGHVQPLSPTRGPSLTVALSPGAHHVLEDPDKQRNQQE